ncbi:hypothetical protein [Bacillus alkalicellulosilyticus]|uniref:hypothetical protein n=1 Tax=Alkalihalobacterium alkalicellulosilyticum TaxID=1912214 RepID=UPI001FE7A249|nr:hypothetical protein [Bacillus alkalicellulosilyticus]
MFDLNYLNDKAQTALESVRNIQSWFQGKIDLTRTLASILQHSYQTRPSSWEMLNGAYVTFKQKVTQQIVYNVVSSGLLKSTFTKIEEAASKWRSIVTTGELLASIMSNREVVELAFTSFSQSRGSVQSQLGLAYGVGEQLYEDIKGAVELLYYIDQFTKDHKVRTQFAWSLYHMGSTPEGNFSLKQLGGTIANDIKTGIVTEYTDAFTVFFQNAKTVLSGTASFEEARSFGNATVRVGEVVGLGYGTTKLTIQVSSKTGNILTLGNSSLRYLVANENGSVRLPGNGTGNLKSTKLSSAQVELEWLPEKYTALEVKGTVKVSGIEVDVSRRVYQMKQYDNFRKKYWKMRANE